MGIVGDSNLSPSGNRSADEEFKSVYLDTVADVSAYIARRVDLDDVADLVAEVFAIVWRRFDQRPDPESVRLWIYGIARYAIKNQRRTTARRSNLFARVASHEGSRIPPAKHDLLEFELVLLSAIRQMPADYQEVLFLRAWEELQPSEIATVIGVSPSAARKRLLRARRMLERILESEGAAVAAGGWLR